MIRRVSCSTISSTTLIRRTGRIGSGLTSDVPFVHTSPMPRHQLGAAEEVDGLRAMLLRGGTRSLEPAERRGYVDSCRRPVHCNNAAVDPGDQVLCQAAIS